MLAGSHQHTKNPSICTFSKLCYSNSWSRSGQQGFCSVSELLGKIPHSGCTDTWADKVRCVFQHFRNNFNKQKAPRFNSRSWKRYIHPGIMIKQNILNYFQEISPFISFTSAKIILTAIRSKIYTSISWTSNLREYAQLQYFQLLEVSKRQNNPTTGGSFTIAVSVLVIFDSAIASALNNINTKKYVSVPA